MSNLVKTGRDFVRNNLSSGVGGLDDLLVLLRRDTDTDRWFVETRRGHIFRGLDWEYRYIQPQTVQVSLPPTTTPVPIAVLPLDYARYPVRVFDSSGVFHYLPNGMSFYQQVSTSQTGSLYQATVHGLVTDVYLDGNRLLPEPTKALSPYSYHFDQKTHQLLVPNSGDCRVSYVRLVPSLLQECMVYSTGSYQIETRTPPVVSTLVVHTPTGVVASGVSATGCTVQLSTYLPPGYYAVSYYTDRSFCLVPSSNDTAVVLAYSQSSTNLTIEFESEPYKDWYTVISENLNPLQTNRRFFFVADIVDPLPDRKPEYLIASSSPPFIYLGLGSMDPTGITLTVTVQTIKGEPVSGANVTVTPAGTATVYRIANNIISAGNTSTTDVAGSAFFLVYPSSDTALSGMVSMDIVVQKDSYTLNSSTSVPVVMVPSLPAEYTESGSDIIVLRDIMQPMPDAEGWYTWILSATHVDGTPFQRAVSIAIRSQGGQVVTEKDTVSSDGILVLKVKPEQTMHVSAVAYVWQEMWSSVQSNEIERRFRDGGWI